MPKFAERKLLGVIALIRHEGVEIGSRRTHDLPFSAKRGRHVPSYNPDHLTGLSEEGQKGATETGKRIAQAMLENEEVAAQLKKEGLHYFGRTTPMTRGAETMALNFVGVRDALQQKGVKLKRISARAEPALAIAEHMSRGKFDPSELYYFQPKSPEEEATVKRFVKYVEDIGVKGIESPRSVRKRMQIVTDLEHRLKKWKAKAPALVHLVSHGGIGGKPAQIDDAAVWLAGKHIEDLGGPLQRGEGLLKFIYSDGTTDVQVLRKEKKEVKKKLFGHVL